MRQSRSLWVLGQQVIQSETQSQKQGTKSTLGWGTKEVFSGWSACLMSVWTCVWYYVTARAWWCVCVCNLSAGGLGWQRAETMDPRCSLANWSTPDSKFVVQWESQHKKTKVEERGRHLMSLSGLHRRKHGWLPHRQNKVVWGIRYWWYLLILT